MATTTNYGWTTPDDTSLVKDGAAAIRTLGSSVDTTTKALNPSTTLGDIEYRSATANTNTRLAIGSTSQVLTVAGGVPTWATPSAGGMTSIASGSLSGGALTLTSISGSYKDLRLVLRDYNGSNNFDFLPRANSVILYTNARISTTDTAGTSVVQASGLTNDYLFVGDSACVSGDNNNSFMIDIYDYADTSSNKLFRSLNKYVDTSSRNKFTIAQGSINTSSAITSFTMTLSAGTFSGGTYVLYGVN
jgi:hypothetical protein